MAEPYKFMSSPLMTYVTKLRNTGQLDTFTFHDALQQKNNLTEPLFYDCKYRILNKLNHQFSIFGQPGTGKSTIAQSIEHQNYEFTMGPECKHLVDEIIKKYGRGPVFDVSNVCFSTSELLDRVQKSVRLESFIKDESDKKIIGAGSMREKYDEERLLKRVRAMQHNFVMIDPKIQTDGLSELHLFRLEALDYDRKHKVNRSILNVLDRVNAMVPIGHIITPFYEIPGYIEKKDAQIKAIEAMSFGDRMKFYTKLAEEMIEKEILEYPLRDWKPLVNDWTNLNYSKAEVDIIVSKVKVLTAQKKEVKLKNVIKKVAE
jgi:hypothetical protein